MIPSQQVLEQIAWKIMSIPNQGKENKWGIHFGGMFIRSQITVILAPSSPVKSD